MPLSQKKNEKKRKHMFWAIFTNYLMCTVALILIAAIAISCFVYDFILREKGQSRVDVLEQISDSNTVNRNNMVNVMNMVYEDFYDVLLAPYDSSGTEQIQKRLEETADLLQRMGMDYTVDIQMNDKRSFSTVEDPANINALKSTYWYIKHYSGEIDTSWNLRFLDVDDITSYGLSYGKTLYDDDGRGAGVIIITAGQESLFRTFQQLVQDGAMVYILDQNGIIISSSNPNRIGNWMSNMQTFEETYGYNSYTMVERGGEQVLMSNYRDTVSGWTFIEEQNVTALLRESLSMLGMCILVILLSSMAIAVLAYIRVRKATTIIRELSRQIGSKSADDLSFLPVSDAYEETYTLSTTFNGMLDRIQTMIGDIQRHEQEKQKTEYDFLYAQINPHFLNNSLIAIKSLISMGDVTRAGKMMSELVDLLHLPSTSDIPFVCLKEELHLVQSYLSIMNCRTDKAVELQSNISPDLMDLYVPRMILQPVIGNSIFHGFAEKTEGCLIRIDAICEDDILEISITDNGDGILPGRLAQINTWDYTSADTHRGIGLKNIRQRLRIIYGGCSDLIIRSTPGEFTSVRIIIDGCREKHVGTHTIFRQGRSV